MNETTQRLARVRQRMMTQLFLERLTWCALAFGGVWIAAAGINHLRHRELWDSLTAGAMATATLVCASVWTWLQRLSLDQVAGAVDRLGQTRDRFLTAFSFSKTPTPTPMQLAALNECEGFIKAFDDRPLTRLRIPSEAAYLLVPLVAAGLLTWHARLQTESNRPDPQAQAELTEKAGELEKLAKKIETANEKLQSEELKKIAEQLKKSAGHLQTAKADEAAKAGLRELSALEAMIQQMQPPAISAEELAAMAEALKQNQSTKAAAEAMQANKLSEAADKLEALAKSTRDKTADEALAKAVREAMSRLSADAQSRLAKQSGQSGDRASEALQRLAQLLKQMPRPGQSSGRDGKSQAIQNALSVLQNLKYASQESKAGNQGKAGESGVAMQSFIGTKPTTQAGAIISEIPSGLPGTERDEGTTKTPFGAKKSRTDEPGAASELTGTLGEGESLHDLISTTGDTSKAARRYRELYDAMAPAAQDAILQDNIPLGSRFFVKRYFQNIRPKE